jgi:hypothetical protein
MPCGCEKDRYIDPEGLAWGPLLWRVLHGLAERIGTCVPLFVKDERIAWYQLLTITGEILPCENFRTHYKSWIKLKPILAINTLTGTALREFIRTWLWSLHDNVCRDLGKPSIEYSELGILYANTNVELPFRYLNKLEQKAILEGYVKPNQWAAFIKHYRFMASIYGLA